MAKGGAELKRHLNDLRKQRQRRWRHMAKEAPEVEKGRRWIHVATKPTGWDWVADPPRARPVIRYTSFWHVGPYLLALPGSPPARPTLEAIKLMVADYYGFTVLDLVSHRRTAKVTRARQMAQYICRTTTPHSLPVIGAHFGGRDHTTILHAVRKIDADLKSSETTRADYHEIVRRLRGGAPLDGGARKE